MKSKVVLSTKNKFVRLVQGFNMFDYLLFALFVSLALGFFIFLFRNSPYITIKIRVTEKNVLYVGSAPPYWFVYLFKKGMKEKDGLGRLSAEVIDVYYYNTSPNTKVVYLTVKLRTTYTSRTEEYRYKGTTVSIGEGIKINLGTIIAEGLITEVESLKNSYTYTSVLVDARILDYNQTFSETTGVQPFIADAMHEGDRIVDSRGDVIAEVIEKQVLPAKKNTLDSNGNVYLRTDPSLKDVTLRLKLRAKKILNDLYFLDDVKLNIGQPIPLQFQHISLMPVITNITTID